MENISKIIGVKYMNRKRDINMESIKNYEQDMKDLEELLSAINLNSDTNEVSSKLEKDGENNMNSLQVLEHNGERVLMTKQLAEYYGSSENNLKHNFQNNKARFRESKDYFLLKGNELKEFKRKGNDITLAGNSIVTNSHLVPKNVNTLYLWTETGALRHSKILDTDEAWDQFKVLEDCYFQVKNEVVEKQEQKHENVYVVSKDDVSKILGGFNELMAHISFVISQNNSVINNMGKIVEQLQQSKPGLKYPEQSCLVDSTPQEIFNDIFVKPVLENGAETKEVTLHNGMVATVLVEKHPNDQAVEKLAKQLNDNSLNSNQTYKKIYREMEKYDVNWSYYRRAYKKRHNIKSRNKVIPKSDIIKESQKLTNLFDNAVSSLLQKEG